MKAFHFLYHILQEGLLFQTNSVQFLNLHIWNHGYWTEIPQLPSISFLVFSVLHDTLNVHAATQFLQVQNTWSSNYTSQNPWGQWKENLMCLCTFSRGKLFPKDRLSSHKEYIRNIRLDVHKLSISSSVRSAIKYHCKYIGSVPF